MAAATKPIGAPNPRDESDPLLGAVINGKFRIVGVVAAGGMGKIYRAEQLPLGRPVAIKVLHARYTRSEQDPAFQKRFFLEASILSKLQHPNIVTVFDYGRIEEAEEEAYFMAMEYLPGETLHRRLKAHGPLSTGDALALARQIARGLREAHRHGVVHRDLKPSNVMLVPEDDGAENLKILDFGLVKVLADDSEELTKEGSFLGSPRYMSPEQIAHGRVDLRTDVYSLGVILYQCLTGSYALRGGDNSVHILMAHLQMPVPSLREKKPLGVCGAAGGGPGDALPRQGARRPTAQHGRAAPGAAGVRGGPGVVARSHHHRGLRRGRDGGRRRRGRCGPTPRPRRRGPPRPSMPPTRRRCGDARRLGRLGTACRRR
jgi:serine/threonine protein kinase